NMDGINNSPYVYFLPAEDTEGFGGLYERLLEKLEQDLGRGIIEGNMLVVAAPAPEKTTEVIETAAQQVPAGTTRGAKGRGAGAGEDHRDDRDRVQAGPGGHHEGRQGPVRRHPDPRRARAHRCGAGGRELRLRRRQVRAPKPVPRGGRRVQDDVAEDR